jgi:dolichol-phosphate mannosyltransferase
MRVLIVLPTYNEVGTIEEVLRRIRTAVPESGVLVVDDGSPDGTAEVVTKLMDELGGVDLIQRDGRRGLGDAYRVGFAWGLEKAADVLVEMDSDLSHDPAALPSLLSALADHDLAIGSRYVTGGSIARWGLHRRVLSWGANRYSSLVLGLRVRDMTSGFRAYRASLIRSIDLEAVRADGYGFQIEMTLKAATAGARITEVPIRFVDREQGQSKMSSAIVVEALILVTTSGITRAWAAAKNARIWQPVRSWVRRN